MFGHGACASAPFSILSYLHFSSFADGEFQIFGLPILNLPRNSSRRIKFIHSFIYSLWIWEANIRYSHPMLNAKYIYTPARVSYYAIYSHNTYKTIHIFWLCVYVDIALFHLLLSNNLRPIIRIFRRKIFACVSVCHATRSLATSHHKYEIDPILWNTWKPNAPFISTMKRKKIHRNNIFFVENLSIVRLGKQRLWRKKMHEQLGEQESQCHPTHRHTTNKENRTAPHRVDTQRKVREKWFSETILKDPIIVFICVPLLYFVGRWTGSDAGGDSSENITQLKSVKWKYFCWIRVYVSHLGLRLTNRPSVFRLILLIFDPRIPICSKQTYSMFHSS